MDRRVTKAPKVKTECSTEGSKTTAYRTIVDLPLDLLHMILVQFRDSRWNLDTCMKVCRTLRHAALEYLAFKSPRVDDLDHFLTFMASHRLPPKTVRSLHLSNVSLDAALVREIAQLFPNLKSLTLVDISCILPLPNHRPPSDPETTAPVPTQFNSLTLSCKRPRRDSSWSLSGMMHILSLLAPSELTVWMGHGVSFRDTFDPSCLAASPATVWDLDVGFTGTPKKSAIATVLDALSRTLAPGALQSVEVRYDSKAALRAPGTLLARIGSNVTNLAIHPPAPSELEERHQTWTDPFDESSIHVAAGLLAYYASPTLRRVVIDLDEVARPTTLGNRAVVKF
ncbi:hypothetical protein OH76DRAFT_1484890 [Lentinus brumalis]|uniref:F-box domain-containing protein n=1 Tax=Lentinus brumalis TaxID=2498619 RepID=A0A371D429_9APHY|nr:hypothetical protein OH76DRAFT_1484890 [Polyporus brumalis]